MIVTGRDFRANQSRYISIAHSGEDVEGGNNVYIENGEVKVDIVTDTMSIEEAKELTLKAIELEYMLP